jgi:hypothetical protein
VFVKDLSPSEILCPVKRQILTFGSTVVSPQGQGVKKQEFLDLEYKGTAVLQDPLTFRNRGSYI